jgi:hypothetical protein
MSESEQNALHLLQNRRPRKLEQAMPGVPKEGGGLRCAKSRKRSAVHPNLGAMDMDSSPGPGSSGS